MKRARLSRRDAIGLAALGIGAAWGGAYLGRALPQGEDISDRIDVAGMAGQPGFPGEGPDNAPIAMLVLSDYACGICREVEPWWREAAKAAGDVRVVHRDWPVLGPTSQYAAQVALAAKWQDRYLPVHNALMRSQGLSESALRGAADQAGADWDRLQSDLAANQAEIDRLLARTARDAVRLAFRGTPGFLIGPLRIEGGVSQRQFAGAMAKARELVASPASPPPA